MVVSVKQGITPVQYTCFSSSANLLLNIYLPLYPILIQICKSARILLNNQKCPKGCLKGMPKSVSGA